MLSPESINNREYENNFKSFILNITSTKFYMTYFYFAEKCGQNWAKLKIGPKLDRKNCGKNGLKLLKKIISVHKNSSNEKFIFEF